MTEEKIQPSELILRGDIVDTDMEFYTIYVDAELARDLLQWNQEPEAGVANTNRKASEAKVTEYAGTMLAGEWRVNPHAAVFSKSGWQEDGQQRLKALIKASQSDPHIKIPLTICVNAPDDARMVMDLGKRRTPADFLKMAGQTNTNVLAAALKMIYCYDNIPRTGPEVWRKTRWTPTLQAQVLAEHPMAREAIRVAGRSRHLLSVVPGAVLWYLIYRAMGDGGEKANWFFRGLEKGVNPDEVDARYLYREGLARATVVHRDWDSADYLGIGIKAFNNWAVGGGSDGFVFGLRKNERFPKIISAAQSLPLDRILSKAELKAIEEATKEIKTGDRTDKDAAAMNAKAKVASKLLHG